MKCIWCGKGNGNHFTKNQEGKVYYYICWKCTGFYIEEQEAHVKTLIKRGDIKEHETSKDLLRSSLTKVHEIFIELERAVLEARGRHAYINQFDNVDKKMGKLKCQLMRHDIKIREINKPKIEGHPNTSRMGKIKCEWCGLTDKAPYRKLKDEKGFVCNECFKPIMEMQYDFDNMIDTMNNDKNKRGKTE